MPEVGGGVRLGSMPSGISRGVDGGAHGPKDQLLRGSWSSKYSSVRLIGKRAAHASDATCCALPHQQMRGSNPRVLPSGADPEARLRGDVKNIKATAAKRLPRGSKWHKCGGKDLEEHLAYTTLIDSAWLLKFALGDVMPELKGVVPAWQQVPPEAMVKLEDLRYTTMNYTLPVGVLSYGWAAKHHPDPTGEQLHRLVPLLRTMVEMCEKGTGGSRYGGKPRVWGIVWDYMSLPQRGHTTGYVDDERDSDDKVTKTNDDRSPYELARFGMGLKAINVWYAHAYVTTLVLDTPMPTSAVNSAPVEQRGWCLFERALSNLVKNGWCCLALSQLPAEDDSAFDWWRNLVVPLRASRAAPLSPDEFERILTEGMAREDASPGSGIRFTNGKDARAVCIPQYREAFLRLLRGTKELEYGGCGWGDPEAEQFAIALEWAHEHGVETPVTRLYLGGNALTDASLPRLIAALAAVTPRLEKLFLRKNKLSDAGARVLAAAISDGKLPKLKKLDVLGNAIGDEAKAELEAAWRGAGRRCGCFGRAGPGVL